MLKLESCVIDNGEFRLKADLSVGKGKIVAVIGPSGAGKSTLLEAVAGFLPVSAGRISWDGRDITEAAPGARPVAMLFQDGNLFPHLTAAQNVGLGIDPNLRLDAEATARSRPRWRVSVWRGLAGASRRSCRADSKAGWHWRGCWCRTGR